MLEISLAKDVGFVPTNSYVPVGDSGYYGAQIWVTNGTSHTVVSSSPIGVQTYGLAPTDGYGYPGGETNVPLAALPYFTNNVPTDTRATNDVLANDRFSNRNDVVLILLTPPAHGTNYINAFSNIVYTATNNFTGIDQFTYQITENGNSSSNFATIGLVSQPPVATNFTVTTIFTQVFPDIMYGEEALLTTNAVAQTFDPGGHPLNVLAAGPATYGLVFINSNNFTYFASEPLGGGVALTYTNWPAGDFTDSFTYTVGDGHGGTATGTITVKVSQ